jgi:hypothetical protein
LSDSGVDWARFWGVGSEGNASFLCFINVSDQRWEPFYVLGPDQHLKGNTLFWTGDVHKFYSAKHPGTEVGFASWLFCLFLFVHQHHKRGMRHAGDGLCCGYSVTGAHYGMLLISDYSHHLAWCIHAWQ